VATGKLPSSTILRLPGGQLQARPDLTLAEWALLCRVDGQRPLSSLADRSGRGHYEDIALAERLLAMGLLEQAGTDEGAVDQQASAAGAEVDGRVGADEAGAARQAGAVRAEVNGRVDDRPGSTDDAGTPHQASAAPEGEVGDRVGAIGTEVDDRGAPDVLAAAELAGLTSVDATGATGEGEQPAGSHTPAEEHLPADAQTVAEEGLAATDTATQQDVAAAAVPGLQDGGAAGAAGVPGRERIDPVSLLRELASEGPAAEEGAPGGDGRDLSGPAARLAGGGRAGGEQTSAAREERRPRDEPARAPGRGANQAEFLREFASLAMGGDQTDDPDPGPPQDGEPVDDERGRGRFGFRRGQRR
jgi:hypothetical protein